MEGIPDRTRPRGLSFITMKTPRSGFLDMRRGVGIMVTIDFPESRLWRPGAKWNNPFRDSKNAGAPPLHSPEKYAPSISALPDGDPRCDLCRSGPQHVRYLR